MKPDALNIAPPIKTRSMWRVHYVIPPSTIWEGEHPPSACME